jgi:rhodanese-related sulfurtransferase
VKSFILSLAFASVAVSLSSAAPPQRKLDNPRIDMQAYLKVAQEAAKHRESRRVTEDEFIRMSREQGTIVLDCRSQAKYDLLHVNGAINLSFPDIDVESLQQTLPDKSARILIYCNNNFKNSEKAFTRKSADASLNLSTYISLYSYGYHNVYELAPLIDANRTKLTLVSTPQSAQQAR